MFSAIPFRDTVDSFEWLENSNILEPMMVDRYAFRAIACYLMDYLKEERISLERENGHINFGIRSEVPDYVLNDLRQISLLSNFDVYLDKKRLLIRVR